MRTTIIGLALLVLSACNPTTAALVSGQPNAALDLAAGSGAVQRDQNGQVTFRYVFAENHLNGLVEPDLQEETRLNFIGQFVAERNICPTGWKIDNKSDVSNSLLYEGSCRG
ncbi:hypothetical protein HAT86_08390 [Roseovarius gahaiensis]|uniref:Uncharacterized protein n=1 Tax=Roseovarius gahaiensis TaxID=2716691 RepID=A0A967BCY2_9RHOB|nr:hypothetical protein [Roseovarius gahaiensis]NHQ74483.1 hypothetical protein [Roseovarius gahaiensis]